MDTQRWVESIVEMMSDGEVEAFDENFGRLARKELAAEMAAAGIPASRFDDVLDLLTDEVNRHREMLADQREQNERDAIAQEDWEASHEA